MKPGRIIPMLMAGFLIVLAVTLFGGGTALAGDFAGGTGVSGDPYQITTAAQLADVNNHLSDNSSRPYFILMNNIDLASYSNWTPIGSSTNKFYGSFDGQNYKITGLTINSSSQDIGLFGYTGADIKNVQLAGVNVRGTGTWYTGSLAGINDGTITNCYATGTVTGINFVGGLVGGNVKTITNCYATCSVTGECYIGGLVGTNTGGTITCCYAAGTITGNGLNTGTLGGTNVGGLAGENAYSSTITCCYATGAVTNLYNGGYTGGLVGSNSNSSTITNCYAAGSVTGSTNTGGLVGNNASSTITNCYYTDDSNNGYGTQKSAADMQLNAFVINLNTTGSTASSSGKWTRDPSLNNGYPIFAVSQFTAGHGTAADPYQITTAEQLNNIRNDLYSYYKLMNDIDLTYYLSADGAGYNGVAGWVPVGGIWNAAPVSCYTDSFGGNFDGQNYKITGLTINLSSGCIGLFGFASGVIKNLRLEGVNVQNTAASGTYPFTGTGSLAGINQGKIIDCYATGSVTGNDNIGGLVGYNDSTTASIYHSYATCNVTGVTNTGGLVGYNTAGITCCDYTDASWNLPVYRGFQWKANGSDYDIRFIATIDTLDPDSVGFVYSNTNYTNLTTEDTIIVHSETGQVDSWQVNTTTVYSSILENGNPKEAERMGGNYIMACPVTVPGAWGNNPIYIRAYATIGSETTYTSMFTIYGPYVSE